MIAEFEVDGFVAQVHGSMTEVAAGDWDACGTAAHPFLQHRHLRVLEASGLAAPGSGVEPRPLLLRDRDGRVAGVAPAYLKDSSLGEAGVDLGLPLAHLRAAGPYYPKLQVEVPMVPTPGPRLLVRDGSEVPRVRAALVAALVRAADLLAASSVQIAFATREDQAAAETAGFTPSEGNIFVWRSVGERSFDEFLASMHQKGRYRVRHDRSLAGLLGLEFERLGGDRITPALAGRMHDLYLSTFQRHGSAPYLTLAYFEAAFAAMPDALDLLVARRGDDWTAVLMGLWAPASFHALHWGSVETGGSLIFEMFYRELEAAIAAGRGVVDFGPAGQHKTLRGIGIEPTRHALWFRDERFRPVAAAACARRSSLAAAERAVESLKLPFADKAARAARVA